MTHFPDAAISGRLIRTQVLTSGTSYSKASNCNAILIEILGAGGAGGGALTGSSASAASGGGGAGAYAMKYFDVSNQAGPFTYVIGQGGLGISGATGNDGGDSSFTVNGITVTGKGGKGAFGGAAVVSTTTHYPGGAGQLSTNGDVNGGGQPGYPGIVISATIAMSGGGGDSIFGRGGRERTAAGTGNAAIGFGSGGGGGLSINNSGQVAGGAGSNGTIVVREYT